MTKKEFKNSSLYKEVEAILNRPLSIEDMNTIIRMKEKLGTEEDLIINLLSDSRGKVRATYEKAAVLAEKGIIREEQYLLSSCNDDYIKKVIDICKINRKLTNKEMEIVLNWRIQYEFHEEILLEACKMADEANANNKIAYASGILKNWKTRGINHNQSGQAQKSSFVGFNDFEHRQYDMDTLEKMLLSNGPYDMDEVEKILENK